MRQDRQETEQTEGRIAWRFVLGTDPAMVKRETEREYKQAERRAERKVQAFAAGILVGILAMLAGIALTRM
jgi:hypothetical protein